MLIITIYHVGRGNICIKRTKKPYFLRDWPRSSDVLIHTNLCALYHIQYSGVVEIVGNLSLSRCSNEFDL